MSEFYKAESRLVRGAVLAGVGVVLLSGDTSHNVAAARAEKAAAAEAANRQAQADHMAELAVTREVIVRGSSCKIERVTDYGPQTLTLNMRRPERRNALQVTVSRQTTPEAQAAIAGRDEKGGISASIGIQPKAFGKRAHYKHVNTTGAPVPNGIRDKNKPSKWNADESPWTVKDTRKPRETFWTAPYANWQPGSQLRMYADTTATTIVPITKETATGYKTHGATLCANMLVAKAVSGQEGAVTWELQAAPGGQTVVEAETAEIDPRFVYQPR